MAPSDRSPPLNLIRTSLAGLGWPGQWLRETAAPVDFDEVDLAQRQAVVRGLLAAMHAPPGGVGLAATMAGLDLRVVIAEDGGRTLAMFNPEVVETGGAEVAMAEGNLCLPGVHGEVVRPSTLTVRWEDVHATRHAERFDGWLARILFHELELLDGRFFTDHVARTALAGLGGDAQPLNVLTLPPELQGLRRTVLRRPAAPVVAGSDALPRQESGDAAAPQSQAAAISPRALQRLIAALRLTLGAGDLVALAAPQVGIGLRVAVVDDPSREPLTLVDATVVDRSEQTETAVERCSSLPGHSAPITRAQRIRVRNHTPDGEPYELDADGDLARRIEHALDHLDGVLRPLHG
jgi:peptide deformylase